MAELEREHIISFRLPVVDRSGKLSAAAAAVLDLTPTERDAITRALDATRPRLAEFEAQNAAVTRNPSGSFTLSVRPFPEAGGAVYDGLMKALAETLGPNRNAALVQLAGDQFDRAFNQFGATARTLTVTPRSAGNGYTFRDEQVVPGGGNSVSGLAASREELGRTIGTLVDLLPPAM